MLTNLIFKCYILLGMITPDKQIEPDDRLMYTIHTKSTCVVYAYEEEIKEWIETGTFEYDDTLD